VEPENSRAASSSLPALSHLHVYSSANEILGKKLKAAVAAAGLEMQVSVIDL
jgi:hypothetical protein